MKSFSKKQKIIIALSAAVFLVLISGYCIYQNNALTLSEYELTHEKLPREFDGFSVAQVSDFHNTRSSVLQESILEELRSLCPDIIVITGDFIDCRKPDTKIALDFAEQLLRIAPVYFSPGNHEARLPDVYESFEEELKNIGVTVLRNSCETIRTGNKNINIIGIDDATFYGAEDEKITSTANALDEVLYDKNLFTITLSHRPEVFSVYTEKKLDLVFSGHAHGGQFVIPYLGGLFSPTEGFFPEFTQGIHHKNNTTMIISRGIGNSVFPIRINNRPEIIFVTLRAANN